MWQALMDWLPDLHVGTFEIRDLLNLLMTAIGAYLAWQAIKMGKEQGEISKRQAGIAEKQDRLMQELHFMATKMDYPIESLGVAFAQADPGHGTGTRRDDRQH